MFLNRRILGLNKKIDKVNLGIDDLKIYSYYEKEFNGYDSKVVEEQSLSYEEYLHQTDASFISRTEPEICFDKSYKSKVSYTLYDVPKSMEDKHKCLEDKLSRLELKKAQLMRKIKKNK